MIPGRSSRRPASRLRNGSGTNSEEVIFFPGLPSQRDVTVRQRKRRALARLSPLRHDGCAPDGREGGGCEPGSSALETRLRSLARAAEVAFWFFRSLPYSKLCVTELFPCQQSRCGESCSARVFCPCRSKSRDRGLN